MKIEKINNFWIPSNDAQIEKWRKDGYPYMQDRCLNRFLKYCDNKNIQFKTVLDIGAWCGTWSLAMQKYAENIFCYEPNKTHFACLEKNLASFSNVSLYNCAIGNEEGFVKLTEETATQNTRVIQEKGDTKICTIDSLNLDNVDLIKIDVEGFEMEVLKGGKETIKNIEYIMIELNNNTKRYGSSNREIEKYLPTLGFRMLFKIWPDVIYCRK
jgi:FkbM family methyltransferase